MANLRSKLLLSHLSVSLFGVAIIIAACFMLFYIAGAASDLAERRGPAAMASLRLLNGVESSMANLGLWVVIEDAEARSQRKRAWDESISPSAKRLKELAILFDDTASLSRIAELDHQLEELSRVQEEVEAIANTPENEPASHRLETELRPILDVVKSDVFALRESEPLAGIAPIELGNLNETFADLWGALFLSEYMLRTYVHSGHPAEQARFQYWMESALSSLASLGETTAYTADQRDLIDRINDQFPLYQSHVDEIVELRDRDDWNLARYLFAEQIVPLQKQISASLQLMAKSQSEAMIASSSGLRKTLVWTLSLLLASLIVMALTAIFFSIREAGRLSMPLIALTDAARKLARGELKGDIRVREDDEIGVLTKTFNEMGHTLTQKTKELGASNVALLDAKGEAERANSVKSEFLANMSHEIRTPMNAILGFSELLKNSHLPSKEKGYLDAIASSGRSLLTLINDILDLSKVEAGKLEISYEAFSLHGLLMELETVFGQKASEKEITVLVETPIDSPEWILMDETRLRQILFNLVSNALKFTHEGGVTIRARGEIDTQQTDHAHLTIEVVDTGIGVTPDDQARIFDSFSQAVGQSTRKYGGTGLGLSISKRLSEMMGGRLSMRSEVGEGSTFQLDFPEATLAADPGLIPSGGASAPDLASFAPATILYADDEELNRTLMQGYFEDTDINLELAVNGKEAVQKAQEIKPDLILMDIRMPELNGIEATKIIKQTSDVTVIALTASSLETQKREIEQVCDMFLSKPISVRVLAQALAERLPLKEQPSSGPEADETQSSESKPGGEEGNLGDDVPADVKAKWPRLIELLETEKEGVWAELREAPDMTDAEDFTRRLRDLGDEYFAADLKRYADQLYQQVELFDIEAVRKTLLEFPGLIEAVKSEAESV